MKERGRNDWQLQCLSLGNLWK